MTYARSGLTHCGVYKQWNICKLSLHMVEYIHCGVDTRWSLHTVEYTDCSVYTRWSMHAMEGTRSTIHDRVYISYANNIYTAERNTWKNKYIEVHVEAFLKRSCAHQTIQFSLHTYVMTGHRLQRRPPYAPT